MVSSPVARASTRALGILTVSFLAAAAAALPAISDARVQTAAQRADRDGDGLRNTFEVHSSRTNPRRADTDGDGLRDGYEVRTSRTDPRKADTDGDGLKDGYEVRTSKTSPRRADTDGDGMNDGQELLAGRDPRRADSPVAKPPLPDPPPVVVPEPPVPPVPDPPVVTPPPADTAAPDTTIASGPSGTVAAATAAFSFNATEPGSSFACRLDAGAWTACTSPKSYAGLANGSHSFAVRATDSAGNADASPASRAWSVDVTPPSPGRNCMADPSVCGFPEVETTGVTHGTALAPMNGTVTLSQPGQVLENKLVTGTIVVTAPNVTIRNVKLVATDDWYGIRAFAWQNNVAGLVIDHVEIDLDGHNDIKGIAFDGYTARNVFIHNGSDCGHMGSNVTVVDSLCVSGPDKDGNGWPDNTSFCNGPEHFDGFQSDGGSNLTLRHNTIRNPCGQTSAILMSTNASGIRDVTIADNLMAGGGYTLYCNAGPDVPDEIVTGNRFARTWSAQGGYWGPTTGCGAADTFSGNVWDDTGAAL